MLLVAKKRIRYPRGEGGIQYEVGDTFETLTERDGKALTLVRFAEEAPKRTMKKTLTLKPPAAIQTTAAAPEKTLDTASGTYLRRDMRATEE